MFGTNDVIYVPENTPLILDDVQRWRRIKFDVRRYGIRLKAEAFDVISERIRRALEIALVSPRFAESGPLIQANVDAMLRGLAGSAGSMQGELPGSLPDALRSEEASWWVRLTDLPAESWFEEDYEREARAAEAVTPHFTFGSVNIAQLDHFEVALPEEGPDRPISVDVPVREGLTRWTIPPLEPLPIIDEFCGMHGQSARGRTINITTLGEVAGSHQFCTPLGHIGGKLYATLYVHYSTPVEAPVMGVLREDRLAVCLPLLERSGFTIVAQGRTWRIYQRGEDIVHVYSGLAGKEVEGVETMPSFLVVACANGQFDQMNRADLFEAIRDTVAAS